MIEYYKNPQWQDVGGSIEVPVNWFVCGAHFDLEEPYIEISNMECSETKKLLFPKPIAYFLVNHFCGSEYMHKLIEDNATRKLQNIIKQALGIE